MAVAVKKQRSQAVNVIPSFRQSDSEVSQKTIWIALGAVAVILAYWLIRSPRPYDDDNIGRYFMAQAALTKPEFFLSMWGRPLAIIFFLIPSQFGYWFCAVCTAVLTIGTCYLTYRAAKESRRPFAWVAVAFLAFQPVFFSTSWSLCTEPLAAFFLAAGLLYFYKKKYIPSALALSLVPLARTEMVLILPFFAFVFVKEKKYLPVALLGTGLALFQVAGMVGTGDMMYLLTASKSFGEGLYQNGPFEHYFIRFIFIVGPVLFLFMILQLTRDVRKMNINVINVSIVAMFCFHVYLYWQGSGIVVGFLRHFVAIAPMMTLLALDGFNAWLNEENEKEKKVSLLILSATAFLILIDLSFNLIGDYYYADNAGNILEKEYSKFVIALAITLFFLFRNFLNIRNTFMKRLMLGMALAATVVYCLTKEKPLQLAPEHQTVKNFHVYFQEHLKDKVPMTMICHPWFFFFDDFNYYSRPYAAGNYLEMRKEKLDQLPVGGIVVWDSHYSWRLSSNVQEQDLTKNPNFKLMQQFISTDRKFGIYLFEKVKGQT